MNNILPAFNANNNIPIFFACNRNYLPVFSVAFQSLISTSYDKNNYDVWLLISDISEQDKESLLGMIRAHKNISLRFLDFKYFIPQDIQKKLYLSRYISLEAYYRIFIPEIFTCYNKLLWLDSDIVIKQDIADLYHIDIKNNWVAMAPNIWTIYAADNNICPEGISMSFKDYILKFLKMTDYNHYCNDGIMIMNAKQLRQNQFSAKCMEALERIKSPNYWDQDLINIVCEEHHYSLPLEWNHVWYLQDYSFLEGKISQELYDAYDKARYFPKIIHYAGNIKPWITPDKWLSDDFWAEARKTPFYSTIILNNTIKNLGFHELNKGPFNPDWFFIYKILTIGKLNLRYLKYKIFTFFSFSKNKKRFRLYTKNLENCIKDLNKKFSG